MSKKKLYRYLARGFLLSAAFLLAAALLLGLPTAVQAGITYVSNIDGPSNGSQQIHGGEIYAQLFRTGSQSGGYRLKAVDLLIGQASEYGVLKVELRKRSSSLPTHTDIKTFSNPHPLRTGRQRFTASGDGFDLNRNTDYYISMRYTTQPASGEPRVKWQHTSSDDQESDLDGWDIADYLTFSESGTWLGSNWRSFKMRLLAENRLPTAADVTVNIDEDDVYTFSAADFNFDDPDSVDSLGHVKITLLPERGLLKLNNTNIRHADLPQKVTRTQLGDGDLNYTPPANANGDSLATFNFRVNDNFDDSGEYFFTFNVTPVGDPPTVEDKTVLLVEDEVDSYAFNQNDFDFDDADNDALVHVEITSLPGSGKLRLNNTIIRQADLPEQVTPAQFTAGDLTYSLPVNANGSPLATFRFKVNAGSQDSDRATFRIDVTAVNDLPTASDKAVQMDEDQDTVYAFSELDFGFEDAADSGTLDHVKIVSLPGEGKGTLSLDDGNGNPLEITSINPPQQVTATQLTDGDLTYSLPADASGNPFATINFKVNDGTADSELFYTVSFNVAAANDRPVAGDDSVVVDANTDTALNVLENDADMDGDTLSVSAVGVPSHGTAVVTTFGSIPAVVYSPDVDFVGPDAFTYTVSDGTDTDNSTDTATVDITVIPRPTGMTALSYSENSTTTVAAYSAPGNPAWSLAGADTDDFNISTYGTSTDGMLNFNVSPDFEIPTDADQDNVYQVTVVATVVVDGVAYIGTRDVTVTVVNVDDDVVWSEQVEFLFPENQVGDRSQRVGAAATVTVTDPENVPFTGWGSVVTDDDFRFTYSASVNEDKTVYTLSVYFKVTPDFEAPMDSNEDNVYEAGFLVRHGKSLYLTRNITVTVTDVNEPPVAMDDAAETDEDTAVEIGVLDNDTDEDADTTLEVTAVRTPGYGTAALKSGSTSTITYTPNPNFNGQDSFTYTVSDGVLTDTGTVTVTVNAVNDAPVAVPDAFTIDEGIEELKVSLSDVLANDSDVEGSTLSVTAVGTSTPPTVGGVELATSTSTIIYTPKEDFAGFDSFTYTVSDGNLTATSTVVVGVRPAVSGLGTLDYEENSTTTVATFTAHGNPTWSLEGVDKHRFNIDVGPSGTSTLGFINPPNFEDPSGGATNDSNDYQVIVVATIKEGDAELISTRNVTVTVTDVNDPPVAEDDAAATGAGEDVDVFVLSNDSDDDPMTTLRVTSVGTPNDGQAVIATTTLNNIITYSIKYSPNAGFEGRDSFTYTVSDGTLTDTGTVLVAVAFDVSGETAVFYLENGTSTVATYTAPGSPTWSLSGDDGDDFTIYGAASGTSTLTFTRPPNYEKPSGGATNDSNDYQVTVVATIKEGDAELTSELEVNVTVTNVNEAPMAVDDTALTDASTAVDIRISGVPDNPGVLDNDQDEDADTLSVTAVGTSTPPTSGSVVLATSTNTIIYTPKDDFAGFDSFTYTVSDGFLTDTGTVTVGVRPVVYGVSTLSYAENGTTTVATFAAAGSPTWSLDGVDRAHFSINTNGTSTDGVLNFNSPPDFETPTDTGQDNVYQVTVIATVVVDGVTFKDTRDVTVTVTGLNEDLVWSEQVAFEFPENQVGDASNRVGAAATVTVTDPENVPFTGWGAVVTDDEFQFTYRVKVSEDGTVYEFSIYFKETPDFEVPADSDEDNVYEAGFLVRHGSSYSLLSRNVTVTVTDVNEPPVTEDDAAETDEDTAVDIVVLDNDTDQDADTVLSVTEIGTETPPINGTAALKSGSTSTITYTPNPNFNGQDSFTYTVSDGTFTETGTVTVNVSAVNDAPMAVADASTTDAGTQVKIEVSNLLENDTDVEGDTLSVTAVGTSTPPTIGSVVFATSTNTITYTPEAGFAGFDSFTYTVSDGNGGTDTGTVTVGVRPVVEGPDERDYAENGTTMVADYTAPGSPRWILFGDDEEHFTIDRGGGLTFDAEAFPFGPNFEDPRDTDEDNDYEITVVAITEGDTFLSYSRNVTVSVTDADDPPVFTGRTNVTITETDDDPMATADNFPENSAALIATFDIGDEDGDPIVGVTTVGRDAANIEASFSESVVTLRFVATTTPDFEDPTDDDRDNVYETVLRVETGDSSNSASSTLSFKVTVTDLPAVEGPTEIGNYAEDRTTEVAGYSATGAVGTVTWSLDGPDSAEFNVDSNGNLTFASTPDYESPDEGDNIYLVTVVATDDNGTANNATDDEPGRLRITVTVTDANKAPVATHDSSETDEETAVDINVVANDTDVDGDTLSVMGIESAPRYGIAALKPGSTSTITYTPKEDFHGEDFFTYTVSDGTLPDAGTDTGTVTVTVYDVNDAPVAVEDFAVTAVNTMVDIDVVGNDTDVEGNKLTVTALGTPSDGEVGLAEDGTSITYIPDTDFVGFDRIYYTVSDGYLTDVSILEVVVAFAIDVEDAVGTVAFAENATHPVAIYTAPGSPTWNLFGDDSDHFTISSGGVLSFDPDALPGGPDFEGPSDTDADNVYEITVSAQAQDCDEIGPACDAGTTSVTVAVVDLPAVNGLPSIDYPENRTVAVDTYSATDADGNAITEWGLDQTGDYAAFSIDGDGVLSFISPPNFETPTGGANDDSNVYQVTVVATDSTGNTVEPGRLAVTVTVGDANDAPAAVDDSVETNEDAAVDINVVGNDTDVDRDTLSVTGVGIRTAPSSGIAALRSGSTSAVTYTPNDNFNGRDSFTYTVSDGTLTATGTVTVDVAAVNDAPVAAEDIAVTAVNTTVDVNVVGNDTDVDGDNLSVNRVGSPGHGDVALDIETNTITYTPDTDFAGVDYIYYTLSDGHLTANGILVVDVEFDIDRKDEVGRVGFAENAMEAVATYTAPGSPTWSLQKTGDHEDFRIDSSGNLAFAVTPDYENPVDEDGDNAYQVTVVATVTVDSVLVTDTLPVTVFVTDVDEAPVVSGPSPNIVFAENGEGVVGTFTATDPEGDTIAWSLEGHDSGDFNIAISGAVTFASAPDFENPADTDADNVYEIAVKALSCDEFGDTCNDATLSVTVTVIDQPTVKGLTAIDYAEDRTDPVETYSVAGAVGSVGWGLDGPDSARFSIDSQGSLTFAPTPDYEVAADEGGDNVYQVTVVATDSIDGTAEPGQLDVTVTVLDANEPPVAVDDDLVTLVDTPIVVRPLDNDTDENGDTLILTAATVDPQGAGSAEVGPDGTTFAYIPTPGFSGNVVIVYTVSDSNGGDTDGTVTVNVSSDGITLDGLGITDGTLTPAFSEGIRAYTVRVPSTVSRVRVTPTAFGLSISPEGRSYDNLTVKVNGSPVTSDNPSVDVVLTGRSNTITVAVSAEGTGISNVYTVTVTRLPRPDAPTGSAVSNRPASFTEGSRTERSVAENTPADQNFGTPVSAWDPEGDQLFYTLGGPDGDQFAIDSRTGQLKTRAPLDYEAQSSYQVTVRANVGDDAIIVTIAVINVDEPGTILLSEERPEVGVPAYATLTDPDGEPADVAWQWARSSDRIDWQDIAGATSPVYTPIDGDAERYLRVSATYADVDGDSRTIQAEWDGPVGSILVPSEAPTPVPPAPLAPATPRLTATPAPTAVPAPTTPGPTVVPAPTAAPVPATPAPTTVPAPVPVPTVTPAPPAAATPSPPSTPLAALVPTPEPPAAQAPLPEPVEPDGFNLWWLALIVPLAGAAIGAAGIYLLMRRRSLA